MFVKCPVCEVTKKKSEYYKSALSRCKDCHKTWRMLYYSFHREHTIKKQTEWINNNKHKQYGYVKKWQKLHRDQYNKIQRDYYAKNIEKKRAYGKEQYHKHKNKHKDHQAIYQSLVWLAKKDNRW